MGFFRENVRKKKIHALDFIRPIDIAIIIMPIYVRVNVYLLL